MSVTDKTSEDNSEMVNCAFCGCEVKKNNLDRHLYKHLSRHLNKVQSEINKVQSEIDKVQSEIKEENNRIKRNVIEKINKLSNNLYKELAAEDYNNLREKINDSLSSDLRIQKYKGLYKGLLDKLERNYNSYTELAAEDYNSNLREKINGSLSNESKIQMYKGLLDTLELTYNSDKEFADENYNSLKEDLCSNPITQVYEGLLNTLELTYNSLPTKSDFIKHNTTYITWDDILFDRNFIKINPNKIIMQPIEIEGSLKILNDLRNDYFKKEYKNEKYKLIVHRGICYENLTISKGLKEIKEIVYQHIELLKQSDKFNSKINHQQPLVYFDKVSISDYFKKLKVKNDFIAIPAKYLDKKDSVICLLEINNGVQEESLVYIFKRNSKVFVLWENCNPNRAGYLFEYQNETFNNNKDKLISFIRNPIDYKRESLFRNYEIKKKFDLQYNLYYLLKHEMRYLYQNQLKSIIGE